MDDWEVIKLLFELIATNDTEELEKLNAKAKTILEKEEAKRKRKIAFTIITFAVIVLFIGFGFVIATSNLPDWFKFFLLG